MSTLVKITVNQTTDLVSVKVFQAENGATGATGATGDQGDRAGLKYTFSSNTNPGAPSPGYLKFNSATLSAVTQIAIRDTDFDGTDTTALLALIDDSTSTTKARVLIRSNSNSDASNFNFLVTSVTDEGNHFHINGTYVSGSAFTNNEVVTFDFYMTGDLGATGPAPSGTGFVKVVSGVLQTPSASIAQSVVTNLTSDLALKTNAQTPVLASAASGAYLGITSSDPLSGVHLIEDNFASVTSQFVYRPLGVTEVIYDTGYNIGSIFFWFAGLPDCNIITINNGTGWNTLNLFDAENITYLDFNGSGFVGAFSVPSGLSSLYSLNFENNGDLAGLNFTAGAHPELSILSLSGCGGFNTVAVDATLSSLELANTSTMVGATYTGMGQGTTMTYTDYLSTNVNVRFTRTTANLAQLVVQPTLTLSYLSPTDGPVGLTVAGNTSTGAITAKTVTPFAIAASAISWSVYAYQTKTLSLASYTFTQSGAANGRSLKLYLTQTYVGALSVTWFPTITWSGGIQPTYTNGTTTIVTLVATGTNTFTGSFTTAGTVIAATTGIELITAINANTNASTLVTASSAGTNTGAVGQLSLTNLGSITISKLVARGWTINL